MVISDTLYDQLLMLFRESPRMGADNDMPEGVRYIQVSDTLANRLADELEQEAEPL